MEKDYVKVLLESDKPMEDRLIFAGEMLNNFAEMHKNSEKAIETYAQMVENLESRIKMYEDFVDRVEASINKK